MKDANIIMYIGYPDEIHMLVIEDQELFDRYIATEKGYEAEWFDYRVWHAEWRRLSWFAQRKAIEPQQPHLYTDILQDVMGEVCDVGGDWYSMDGCLESSPCVGYNIKQVYHSTNLGL